MDDLTRTKLQDCGAFDYEATVELRSRAGILRSELTALCAKLPQAGIDSDAEEDQLIETVKSLGKLDKKLGAAITEKRRVFFLETGNNPAAAGG